IPFIWLYAPTHLPQAKSLFALIYKFLMASLVAMFCYFNLVQNIKPTTLSLTTVITPMLAKIIGAVLNHEQLSSMVFEGAFIILDGLILYFYKDIK
ncbi:EamA family transporter, partial [Acinetobacter baumannii]|uniref:EamA family transporter n=1 Tax=Acinetobacter baumannii TaxID=470 RepID=UPI003AF9E59C